MAKPLSDILKGVKKSAVTPGSTGKDPGVDYMPKAGDEQKFVAKHSTEKHDHRTGNGPEVFSGSNVKYSMDDPRMKNFGHKKSNEKSVYEAKEDDEKNAPFSGPFDKDQKAKDKNVAKNAARRSMKDMKGPKKMEEAKCNMTEAGKMCPVHGMSECMSVKKINEDSPLGSHHELRRYADKHGGIDKDDFHHAAKLMQQGDVKGLKKHLGKMDTDPRDHVITHVDPKHHAALGYHMKEEVQHVDEAERSSSYLGTYKSPDEAKEKHGKNLRIRPRLGKDNPNKHLYAKGGPLKRSSSQDIKPEHGTRFDTYSRKKTNEDVEQVDEVLTKNTPAGEWISDFVHSKNPKFAGKSKAERKKQALAAYYAKKRGVKEDLAMPLLGGTDIAKHKTDDTQDEIDMVRTELRALANKAMHMLAAMPKDVHVEPWVQAKIAQAKEMIGSVHDYVVYGNHENEDMADNTGGGAGSAGGSLVMNQMDTPMTFPNMSVDVNTGQNV